MCLVQTGLLAIATAADGTTLPRVGWRPRPVRGTSSAQRRHIQVWDSIGWHMFADKALVQGSSQASVFLFSHEHGEQVQPSGLDEQVQLVTLAPWASLPHCRESLIGESRVRPTRRHRTDDSHLAVVTASARSRGSLGTVALRGGQSAPPSNTRSNRHTTHGHCG